MFNLWLSRSRHPLSLEIVISYDDTGLDSLSQADLYEDYMSPNVSDAIAAAAVHSARWEYLKLHVSANLLPEFKFPMPLLRSLYLDVHNYSERTTIVAFRDLPLLRTVILNLDYTLGLDLPLEQLMSLTLTNASPAACLRFLQQTPNLIHCELHLHDVYDSIRPDMTLPLLESLLLIHNGGRGPPVPWYLNTLIVPVLRNLRIAESFLRPNRFDTLASFISKSSCNLQNVCILGGSTNLESHRRAFPSIHFSSGEYPPLRDFPPLYY
ncbi:hypothetical protein DFH06DRAFT_1167880 [Mycena polygramma]|nr:hypothetical protein DFH06DRAFT_1167880 [Mycena polygramma]